MKTGLSLAGAVRALCLISILAGAAGWALWISRFEMPALQKTILTAALPWLHWPGSTLSFYNTEVLVFAISPWMLHCCVELKKRWGRPPFSKSTYCLAAATGLLFGAAYWSKYTAAFLALGATLYLGYGAIQSKTRRSVYAFLILTACMGISCACLNILNWLFSNNPNPVSSTFRMDFKWSDVLFAFSQFPMAMADADSLWRYVLFHPAHGLANGNPLWIDASSLWLGWLGVPGSIGIVWILRSGRHVTHDSAKLACACLITCFVILMTLFPISTARWYQARYVAPASLALLPLLLEGLAAKKLPVRSKAIVWALLVFYVWVPAAYGAASIAVKAAHPRSERPGPSGLSNPVFSPSDIKSVREFLLKDYDSSKDVWYSTDPVTMLDLPGRAIIVHADFMETEELRKECYKSSAPVRVRLLLPPIFEQNGKGRVIRDSFPQVSVWQTRTIPGAAIQEWAGEII